VADGPPALALAFDRNPDVMNKPPRPPSSRLLDAASLRFIVISGTAKAVGGIVFLGAMPQLGFSLEETRTSVFLYESMMQLVFVYPARRISVVPPPNIWIHITVGVGIAVQALTVILPPLRTLLGLVPLSATVFAAIMFAVMLTWVIAEYLGRPETLSA
jgi:Ca2+-transporting ATPase